MKFLLTWRFILLVIGVIYLMFSALWMYSEPGYEPFITFLAGVTALGGSFFAREKPITTTQISEKEKHARNKRNRDVMLRLVKKIWIDGVFYKSIYKAILIELGFEERKDVVYQPDRPWDMVLQTVEKPNRILPQGTKISDVFDDVGQTLLILGKPGSGKTTTLLELAHEKIKLAKIDSTQPIPVVFNLSSWGEQNKSIEDWLVSELNTKYNIAKKIACAWIENDQLLLLLDGLDEVSIQKRADCVRAINQFFQEHLMPIVICSRTEEYQSLTNSLKIQNAVCIQPLTEVQVCEYFDRLGIEFKTMYNVLKKDNLLQELLRSPLMLNIITLAFQGASSAEIQQLHSIKTQREHIFNKYIERMFNRFARTRSETYPRDKTIKWLSWLAEKMSKEAQSVFFIEGMQPNWLKTKTQQRRYTMITIFIVNMIFMLNYGLIFFLIYGLIHGLNTKLINGLTTGLIFGLLIGMIGEWFIVRSGRLKETIKTVESLKWSTKKAKSHLVATMDTWLYGGLFYGLFIGLLTGLHTGLNTGLIAGLIAGLIWVLFSGLLGTMIDFGLSYTDVKESTIPNQGIRLSIRNAVIVLSTITIGSTLLAAPVALLAAPLVVMFVNLGPNFKYLDSILLFILLFMGPSLAINLSLTRYGGLSAIQHYVIRFILYRDDYVPWNICVFWILRVNAYFYTTLAVAISLSTG